MWSSSGRKSHAKWRCRTSGRRQEVQRCRRRKRPRCAHTADVAQAALLDTQRTRACWTDSCTVSIEPHLQKALSADDRAPRMAFSRNGSFANAIMAARGEACVEKILNVRLCAGRLVLRQRVVAYAGIEHNHASSRVCTPCPVRVPSIVACRRNTAFSCQLAAWRKRLSVENSFFDSKLHILAGSKKAK